MTLLLQRRSPSWSIIDKPLHRIIGAITTNELIKVDRIEYCTRDIPPIGTVDARILQGAWGSSTRVCRADQLDCCTRLVSLTSTDRVPIVCAPMATIVSRMENPNSTRKKWYNSAELK